MAAAAMAPAMNLAASTSGSDSVGCLAHVEISIFKVTEPVLEVCIDAGISFFVCGWL